MSKEYLLWQAKAAYELIEQCPNKGWERVMYLYLFRWAGYTDE